jgi:hypothetical protein
VPSSPTLRQRLDTHAAAWFDLVDGINAAVLDMKIEGKPIDFGALPCGYVPLDVDTFAMDNSGTAKERVGRTYAGVDGYCPPAPHWAAAHGLVTRLRGEFMEKFESESDWRLRDIRGHGFRKRQSPSRSSPRSPMGPSVTFVTVVMVAPSCMAWQKRMYGHHHRLVLR